MEFRSRSNHLVITCYGLGTPFTRLSQLTQTLGEKIHLTSCKLLSQSAAGTATSKPISDWRRSLMYAAGVSACASFSSQLQSAKVDSSLRV